MSTYPQLASGLAPATSPTLEQLREESDFLAALRTMARCFLMSVPDLTDAERTYLRDVARPEECRYPMKNIQRLIDLSKRSKSAAHRMHFAELIRSATLTTDAALDVIAASNHETRVQGAADVAVRAFEQSPTSSTKHAAIEAVRANYAAERELLDAIEHTQVA